MDNIINPRQERGIEIANKNQLRRIDENTYKAKSQSSDNEYSVNHTDSGWVCNCPDHKYHHICCKHIHAVEFSLTLRKTVEKQNITIEPINVSTCPKCQSDKIVKHGIRHNKHGDIQRFSCKECQNRFIVNLGFEKMRATPKSITSAMQLYFTGESLRNVQKFLRLQGVQVSHQTVLNWITRYTKLMKGYVDKMTPQVGDTWRADEVFVKISGNLKYLFAMMDDETRFWIAQEVADSKNNHDARNLFKMANQVAAKKPTKLITDGLPAYRQAFQKEYWTRNSPRIEHESHITLKGDRNNNKMERLNGEFRDREKVTRWIKKMDSVMFDGYQMYHNYLRPHMALDGQTPAEKCGIKINGDNKWLTLIQNATKMK